MKVIKDIEELKNIIEKANKIVFLGGAGVSQESGIPDFRSAKGLYNQNNFIKPERILSHNFFMHQPKIFYDYYKGNLVHPEALPNQGHVFLNELEKSGKLLSIITQNVDGLHQKAGSKNVIELHGSMYKNQCIKCHKDYSLDYILNNDNPIRCQECNGLVKPQVVLYGEKLNEDDIKNAISLIIESDLLIVAGTSLQVFPAANFIKYAKNKLLINLSRSSKDIFFDYTYYGKFAETCESLRKQ